MTCRRRNIDRAAEERALHRISAEVVRLAQSSNLGDRSRVVDAAIDAWGYGARWSAIAELLGVSVRTLERWRKKQNLILRKLGEAGL